MCDSVELPRLAVFSAQVPYGDTTLVLNRHGAESLLKLLQEALSKSTADAVFYQRPESENPDVQRLVVAVGPTEAMDGLVSQFSEWSESQLSPNLYIRKYCKCQL